jgi:actin-related protein
MAPPAPAADGSTTVAAKRKRPSTASTGGGRKPRATKKTKAAADNAVTVAAPHAQRHSQLLSLRTPSRTLVLDNGGDTVKFGWADTTTDSTQPKHMPNVTARLPQQWTVLTGDEINVNVTNPNSCIAVTRSTERGIITNMGNQIQVWKRLLDVLGVMIPLKTETATAFGWNANHTKNSAKSSTAKGNATIIESIPSHQCAVLIGVPPYTPRSVLDHVLVVWLEDFGFAHAGFCVSTVAAAIYRPIPLRATPETTNEGAKGDSANHKNKEVVPIACVVDLGWSAIHIVPVYMDKVIPATAANAKRSTIRRIPLGARHLINIWKYYCSYRQWNLMDSEWIMRDVFEKTAHVSLHFHQDMMLARKIPAGRRPYDCEYVLPDYDSTFTGVVQIPEAVQREIEKQKQIAAEVNDDDDDDENDEDYNEQDMEDDGGDDDDDNVAAAAEEQDSSEDEESPEEIRKQVLKQREEERRRRELEAEQHQVLNITVERFSIPEALFRPSDVGLPSEWASLPQAIVQAIEACPVVYRAGLYRSIQLTGGLSQLPNLKERLVQELRALAPSQYPLDIACSDSPVDQAWKGALKLATEEPYTKWSVSREEWESVSRRGAWKRLLMSKGGYLA